MTLDAAASDEDLAALAQSGDRNAFEWLVRRHKDELSRCVRRYVGHSDDAYDVLQNSLVAAWFGLLRYDQTRPFLPWLRTIALNKCRDFGRRQTVRRMFLKVFAQQRCMEPRSEPEIVAGRDKQDDDLDRLDRAIADLPAFYKEPLLLMTVSGLSQKEAASLLKTTPKAIEMRLYRARQKLQTALGESEG